MTKYPKLRVPKDIQELLDCGPIEETVSFRRLNYRDGSHRLEYATNGPRDYYLWNVTTQTRVESWHRAADMWDYARGRYYA